jgi:hypothetical protein
MALATAFGVGLDQPLGLGRFVYSGRTWSIRWFAIALAASMVVMPNPASAAGTSLTWIVRASAGAFTVLLLVGGVRVRKPAC